MVEPGLLHAGATQPTGTTSSDSPGAHLNFPAPAAESGSVAGSTFNRRVEDLNKKESHGELKVRRRQVTWLETEGAEKTAKVGHLVKMLGNAEETLSFREI